MKKLWTIVNKLNMKQRTKNWLYLGVLMLLNILIGGFIWLLIGRLVLPEISWVLCFMGYPAVFVGILGGTLYLYQHNFT